MNINFNTHGHGHIYNVADMGTGIRMLETMAKTTTLKEEGFACRIRLEDTPNGELIAEACVYVENGYRHIFTYLPDGTRINQILKQLENGNCRPIDFPDC